MCYHTQRREALAELEHESVPHGADDGGTDDESAHRETGGRDEQTETHSPDGPEDADRRPRPVGFA